MVGCVSLRKTLNTGEYIVSTKQSVVNNVFMINMEGCHEDSRGNLTAIIKTLGGRQEIF
jgi:hypothetical protein